MIPDIGVDGIGIVANAAPAAVVMAPSSASLAENASTTFATKRSTVFLTDDALGTNTMSLAGADAGSFEIVGNNLRLKAGVVLDFETKPSFTAAAAHEAGGWPGLD